MRVASSSHTIPAENHVYSSQLFDDENEDRQKTIDPYSGPNKIRLYVDMRVYDQQKNKTSRKLKKNWKFEVQQSHANSVEREGVRERDEKNKPRISHRLCSWAEPRGSLAFELVYDLMLAAHTLYSVSCLFYLQATFTTSKGIHGYSRA